MAHAAALAWRTHLPDHVRQPLLRFYEEDELERVCNALARPPAHSCVRANTVRISGEELAGRMREELERLAVREGPSEHAGVSRYGEVRVHEVIGDAVVIRPDEHDAREILPEGRELVVSRRCAEAVLRGSHIFIPGMMGCSPHTAKGDVVTVLCDVQDRFLRGASTHILSTRKLDPKRMKGFVSNHMHEVSDEKKQQFRLNNSKLSHLYGDTNRSSDASFPELPEGIVVIGKGVMQVDRRVAMSAKEGLGCIMTECIFRAPPLNGLLPGLMYVQNFPSIVVGHVLDPQPGERILDMCASPGGKTTHAAAIMQGEGSVTAIDRTQAKAAVIRENAQHLGLKNVWVLKGDSSSIPPVGGNVPLPEELEVDAVEPSGGGVGGEVKKKIQFDELFDRIILDPPCTALGLRPRLAVDIPPIEMERTPAYQRRMMHVAVGLLKTGGRLVYSTCTINPEENECNVAWALKALPLKLLRASPIVAKPGRPESDRQRKGEGKEKKEEEQKQEQKKEEKEKKEREGKQWMGKGRNNLQMIKRRTSE
ncbi:hypothetical protein GUITHDRAFT_104001 [Guillardia theta CCMP2712]|uniref:SAM-dependent MTase RsmB/NOP-type domain-containing protein n=1 Tax=Guillardia theta (strain CCMP2712) TaxID=905079 RepID=L1JPI9_GUITC|nr:hypothetical protein GUITHDRAFT_104001 [Guillardia theta CCMP2712]EKX50189.1 hypothetical protein GUITHDRAFT_104001 [Guillardia theta CCMP2712]|eukprot:XP_005837169.1 hypothetical protein GUITHDRAFT_104001 [Guillardia theta CCMP2712]